MPKAAVHQVVWLPDGQGYAVRSHGHTDATCPDGDPSAWTAWLADHATFSFHGKAGKANLRKEARQAGADGYWYAYRRRGQQVVKRYAGRTAELTFAHLETLASALSTDASPPPLVPRAATPAAMPASASVAYPAPALAFPTALFAAKLQPPRLRSQLVLRERLFAQLDAALDNRVTIVSAPAGFGKTTITAQWLADRGAHGILPPVAWLALDAGDNDPVRFWRYFIAACQQFHPALGHDALAVLYVATLPPFAPLAQDALLTSLINDLIRSRSSGLLVLEDYHLIAASGIHAGVSFFLDHLPPGLHLVVLSRGEPPLPLARLRARGESSEIAVPDLTFTSDEVQAFFHQALGVSLPLAICDRIAVRVEGWAAGLRLLALALHAHAGTDDLSHAVESLLADNAGPWPFGQYFVSEVLDAQPEPIQRFLLLTSGLGRICADLADAVTGIQDSAALLDILDRDGLFLEPPHDAGGWYRYHALFAEVVQHEARRRLGEPTLRTVALRASVWYAAHQMTAEAIETALQAEDFAQAATLIEAFVGPQLFILGAERFSNMQEFYTLHRWLAAIPTAELERHPALCLVYAAAMLIAFNMQPWTAGGMARITAALDAAEAGWRRQGETARLGEVFAFRALLARMRGALREAATWAQQALAWLPADEMAWRSIVAGVLGTNALFAGDIAEAQQFIIAARELSATLGNRAYLRANTAMLAWLDLERGKLRTAAQTFRLMLAEAREQEDRDDIGRAQSALAGVLYEWNDLPAAQQAITEALEMGRQLGEDELLSVATASYARILHAQGQSDLALEQLAAMESALFPNTTPLRYRYAREMRACQAALRLTVGDLAAVAQWWEERDPEHDEAVPRPQLAQEELLFARLVLAQSQPQPAIARLGVLLAEAEHAGQLHFAMHVRVLLALAYAAAQHRERARQTLHAILAPAQREGYLRVFLDEGTAMEALLRSLFGDVRESAQRSYVQSILRAFARERGDESASSSATPEALSPQERNVLRLLAVGRTNPEIAAELIVSVNTVKAHVKSLYRKLNVRSRVEAGAAARRLHLV